MKTTRFAAAMLGAFLVTACQETGARPTAVVASADSADQVLEGFEHVVNDRGVRRSFVEADTAFFYESSQTTDLRKVRVKFYSINGVETSTLTAKRGKYRWQDGSMDAYDDVVVVTPDGRKLTTSVLKYDSPSNKIWTNKPFTFDRAGEHLEGNSFRSDPDFRNVDTEKPRGAAGEAMLLPGQSDTLPLSDTAPPSDTASPEDSVP